MTADVDTALRSPDAYGLARKALGEMERAKVWPTPLNFELWLHMVGDPEGPLSSEIRRLLGSGQAITEDVSEDLAARFLPRSRLTEEIRDAGAQLSKELTAITGALAQAQRSQAAYGRTLEDAGQHLEVVDPNQLKALVGTLSAATRKIQRENASLEQRLDESTREVARLREHLEQVRRDAMTDALTNLANRKAFDEQLNRLCEESEQDGVPLTLAVLDIDHFKRFNDTWGHQTGDQVIRYVASVIGRCAAPPRVAARYGGEEFGVVFPGETVETAARALEEARLEIASRILKRRSTAEDLGTVTISIGVAQYRKGEKPAQLMDRADKALYASKRGGRNRLTSAERLISPEAAA